jgi:hypothetical protein
MRHFRKDTQLVLKYYGLYSVYNTWAQKKVYCLYCDAYVHYCNQQVYIALYNTQAAEQNIWS